MPQNVLDTDTFNGTNGNTIETYSAHWINGGSAQFNDITIRGSPGIGGTSAAAMNTSQTWTNDQWAEIKVDATNVASNFVAVCVRGVIDGTNHTTMYCGGINNVNFGTDYRIWSSSSGSNTPLGSASGQNAAVNDVINFQVVGTTLTLAVNGITLLTTTDSAFTTGNVMVWLSDATSTIRLAGSWRAGSVTAAAGGPTLLPQGWM
jgi:hypothetical protein